MPVLFVCLDTFVQCFLYSASRVRASDHFQIMQDCKTFLTRFRVGNILSNLSQNWKSVVVKAEAGE